MNKKLNTYIFGAIIAVVFIFCLLILIFMINKAPHSYKKTTLDIRNASDKFIDNMYLQVDKSADFVKSKEQLYYSDKIHIPRIKPNERVIIILDQDKVAAPGMQLRLKWNEYDDCIDDELHRESGAFHIIKVNKKSSLQHITIYDILTQCADVFSFRHYKRIINVTPIDVNQ